LSQSASPIVFMTQSPDSTIHPDPRRKWVLPVTILGSSMGFIDGSVVNVALPSMQASFSGTLATMQWIVNGYMLMLASLILLGGAIGDRYGRRRAFIIGLVIFAIASAACGFAPTAGWLVFGRLLQGLGAALLAPASLAIIGAAYPKAERGRAIGTWAAAAGIMTVLGPPLGGWLVDLVGWRAIFYINPPIAAVTLALAVRLPPDSPGRNRERLDILGSVLAVLALGLLSYGLIALGDGATMLGLAAALASIPTAIAFGMVEARKAAPMLPLWLFRDRSFLGANVMTVLLYAALSAALFFLPFLLMRVHGYTATEAGAAMLPFSILIALGSRLAGGVSDSLGPRPPLVAGALVSALGYAVLAMTGDVSSYWTGYLPGLLLLGAGMTIAIPPLTTTVFSSSPEEMSGTASGINNAAARGGGLVAVAAIGLAFGSADLSIVSPQQLQAAYSLVLWCAAALSLVSVACGLGMIAPKPKDQHSG
jgi:EmrB/QacA subfamily drug resistance transporter